MVTWLTQSEHVVQGYVRRQSLDGSFTSKKAGSISLLDASIGSILIQRGPTPDNHVRDREGIDDSGQCSADGGDEFLWILISAQSKGSNHAVLLAAER